MPRDENYEHDGFVDLRQCAFTAQGRAPRNAQPDHGFNAHLARVQARPDRRTTCLLCRTCAGRRCAHLTGGFRLTPKACSTIADRGLTRRCSAAFVPQCSDGSNDLGILQRRQVARVLAQKRRADDAAHGIPYCESSAAPRQSVSRAGGKVERPRRLHCPSIAPPRYGRFSRRGKDADADHSKGL